MTSKYHNKGTVIDGYKFASKKEGRRYQELLLLQQAGEISDLKVHPVFRLLEKYQYRFSGEWEKPIDYIADFSYQTTDLPGADAGMLHTVVEDVKATEAMQTETFRLKWKWAKYLYPRIDFRLVTNVRNAR
jgi:hypothetical protein